MKFLKLHQRIYEMKKFILCSLFLAIWAGFARSQDSIPVIYNYMDDAAQGAPDWGDDLIVFNGDILVMGNAFFEEQWCYGITLTCYDTTGAKLWTKIHTDPRFPEYQGNRIVSIDDHSFYIGGIMDESNATPWGRFVARYNQQGDTIFFKTYPDPLDNFVVDLAKYSEDTLMMLSARHDASWGDYWQTQIELLDTNGNILQSASYEPDLNGPNQIFRFHDQLYVGGTYGTDTGWYANVKVFINRYDLNLNHLGWSSPSLTINEYFENFCSLGDQLYLTSSITTFFPPDPRNYYRSYLSLITPDGTPLFSTFFGPGYIADPLDPKTVNVGDSILASCVVMEYCKIYFHDKDLNPLCEYIIDRLVTPMDLAFNNKMAFVPPDKLAGTGMIAILTHPPEVVQDPWNFLTGDVLTHVFTNCIYVEAPDLSIKRTNLFEVFPTLASDLITIRCRKPDPGQISIKVYDLDGRLCMEETFHSEIQIDLGGLRGGFYLLRLSTLTHLETHKVVVSR